MTLPLMIIHRHAKFGYKQLNSSGEIVQTKLDTHRRADGQTDEVIPMYPLYLHGVCVGGLSIVTVAFVTVTDSSQATTLIISPLA